MPLITSPGIYEGISNDQYHGAALTPTYALSSSGARKIEKECLKAFWWDSPMNPTREREENAAFDIGTATHTLLLEPHDFDRSVQVIYMDSWRTKDAQQQRDQARLNGLIPLLVRDYEYVKAMRQAFLDDPVCRTLDFEDGVKEATMAWIDAETGVWLRCRPDFLPNHSRYKADIKTAASAHPADFQRAINEHGYYMQAAWSMDAHEAIFNEQIRQFFFLPIEKKPPFLTSVIEVDDDAIEWGRRQNRRAIRRFAKAMETNDWAGYRDPRDPDTPKAFKLGLPRYAITALEAEEKEGAFDAEAK